MSEMLSIVTTDKEFEINSNGSDRVAILVKGIIGVAPFVGPMLAETIASVIPNQKLDRVITFIKVLNDKVSFIEQDILNVKLKTEEFADLLEDSLNQAARALSAERKNYIAALLKNSLSREELTHLEQKKLLALLNENNDIEIILLKFDSLYIEEQDEFWDRHAQILQSPVVYLDSTQETVDKNALHISYRGTLVRLGLVEPKFHRIEKGKPPDLDEKTGMMKIDYYRATTLGNLLLRYIDMKNDEPAAIVN